jgi:16S rRNA (uracil1498-N3)-methyltransferase
MRCFYLPPSQWHAPWRLRGQEAKHLARVLRIQAGETIRMVNGAGGEGIFTVAGVEKNAVLLEPGELIRHAPPLARVTLALGYTKALRRAWLLEKAVELEAAALWFWQGEYSQLPLPPEGKESWHAQMEAGAKQSANPWLPEVRTLGGGLAELIRVRRRIARAYLLWEEERKTLLNPAELAAPGETLLVVGPEGGFSPAEALCLRQAGFTPVSLGRRILRWETAALLCLGLAWFARQG